MEKAMLKKAAAKSLKEIAKLRKTFEVGLEPPHIPDGIVDFLRQNSPSAKVNISTRFSGFFNLKQIKEFLNATKNTTYHSQFAVPGSAVAHSSAAAPASAAPPNLQLCPAE
ncbi:F-box protein [Trifolium medium]|uniref:F-box protein n=1 Tax=Trifolium medium TaxID=97028 RepID=A0A392NH23_9FABA|nr:F-box protein [Trifolium medium]